MIKKSDLPQKHCPVCDRTFRWRKKWRKVWDDVKYCSKRCRQSTDKKTVLSLAGQRIKDDFVQP